MSCLIVAGSFIVFAADQTKNASGQQQEEIASGNPVTRANVSSTKHENSFHKGLDEASNTLTSPFAGVISGSSSEWLTRGVELLLALVVYGFLVGYLARMLAVRL
ncbi:MAG TPA: hypothetical protein VFW29_05715 [Solirubrobacteraceae bacterium]|nr:hypothetical protein [Solirubrobacteraceae bacterium]